MDSVQLDRMNVENFATKVSELLVEHFGLSAIDSGTVSFLAVLHTPMMGDGGGAMLSASTAHAAMPDFERLSTLMELQLADEHSETAAVAEEIGLPTPGSVFDPAFLTQMLAESERITTALMQPEALFDMDRRVADAADLLQDGKINILTVTAEQHATIRAGVEVIAERMVRNASDN